MFSELWNLAVECIMTSKYIIQKEVSEYPQVYNIKLFKNVLHWLQHIYMNTPLSISFIQNKNLLKIILLCFSSQFSHSILCSWLISIHTCRLAWFKLPMFPKKINGKSFSSTIVFIFLFVLSRNPFLPLFLEEINFLNICNKIRILFI